MFSFFVKRSEVVVDCFTHHQAAFEYTPIDYGSKFLPDWWKDTKPSFQNNSGQVGPTIKNCIGLIEYYKNSLIIPSWFEMDLNVYEEGNEQTWTYQSSNTYVDTESTHPREAFKGFALENGSNLKFTSPWLIRTKEEVRWVWSQPTWNLREHLSTFTVLPAVIDFKYQHSTNVNLFVQNETNFKNTIIKPNTPLVSLHPISDKNFIIKNHLISYEDFTQKKNGAASMFLLRNFKEISKLYARKRDLVNIRGKNSTCPFHKND